MIWLIGILGLFAGSVATTAAHRVPRDLPLTISQVCPLCESPIRRIDTIPIVSWITAWGRCRSCHGRIPIRYPVVELATALLFVGMAYRIGLNWELPGYLAFATVTMALVLTDLDWKRIPNRILFPAGGAAAGLLAVGALIEGTHLHIGRAAIAGLIYFGIMLIMALASRGGMGMGDVKLAGLLGYFTGFLSWGVMIAGAIIGFVLGGMIGLALLLAGKKGMKDEVPFGPPLIVGAWMVILGEPAVQSWIPYLT